MGTTGGDHVVVDGGAAATVQDLLGRIRTVNTLLARIATLAGSLADPEFWDSAGAERFRANSGTFTGNARTAGQALETTATSALTSIQGIDNADAANGVGGSGPAGAVVPMGFTSPGSSGLPPVYGWPPKNPPPVVDEDGAFQPDSGEDFGKDWWFTVAEIDDLPALTSDPLVAQEGYAWAIVAGARLKYGPDAANFFAHYLEGTGSDLRFDSTDPYHESTIFQNNVDKMAFDAINKAKADGRSSFDSGYVYTAHPFGTDKVKDGDKNWYGAIDSCFVRTSGHRKANGTWVTDLQVTSYYQFTNQETFGPYGLARGDILHEMEREGLAKDFRSIGTGTLTYDKDGKPISG